MIYKIKNRLFTHQKIKYNTINMIIINIHKSIPLNNLLYLIAKLSEYENSKEHSPV